MGGSNEKAGPNMEFKSMEVSYKSIHTDKWSGMKAAVPIDHSTVIAFTLGGLVSMKWSEVGLVSYYHIQQAPWNGTTAAVNLDESCVYPGTKRILIFTTGGVKLMKTNGKDSSLEATNNWDSWTNTKAAVLLGDNRVLVFSEAGINLVKYVDGSVSYQKINHEGWPLTKAVAPVGNGTDCLVFTKDGVNFMRGDKNGVRYEKINTESWAGSTGAVRIPALGTFVFNGNGTNEVTIGGCDDLFHDMIRVVLFGGTHQVGASLPQDTQDVLKGHVLDRVQKLGKSSVRVVAFKDAAVKNYGGQPFPPCWGQMKQDWEECGLVVSEEVISLTHDKKDDIMTSLLKADVFWAPGGSGTDYVKGLYKNQGIADTIRRLVRNHGVVYFGSSAGTWGAGKPNLDLLDGWEFYTHQASECTFKRMEPGGTGVINIPGAMHMVTYHDEYGLCLCRGKPEL